MAWLKKRMQALEKVQKTWCLVCVQRLCPRWPSLTQGECSWLDPMNIMMTSSLEDSQSPSTSTMVWILYTFIEHGLRRVTGGYWGADRNCSIYKNQNLVNNWMFYLYISFQHVMFHLRNWVDQRPYYVPIRTWWKFNLDTYHFISSENQCLYTYIIQKWGQNLKKMGFGYQHFHPKFYPAPLKYQKKMFSNMGFIVFKKTGFATPFQRSNP